MILTFYIAKRFLKMFCLVFGAFLGILLLIEVIEQLRRRSDQAISMGEALYLAALKVPFNLYQIFPLIMMLAAIALFIGLARSSELVVVRASGRSGLRFLLTPVVTSMVIGMLAVAVLNPLVAATSKAYLVASARMENNSGAILSVSAEGLWMRQGSDAGQMVIKAARANPDGSELLDVSFQTFSTDGTLLERIEAQSARLEPGAWVLQNAKRWPLDGTNPEREAKLVPSGLRLPTDLTLERLRDGFGTPSAIAFWALPGYIQSLERAGFSARRHRVWMQMELTFPLFLSAMVLIAAGFTMRHARAGKTGSMVLFALLGGFTIFFIRNFAQVLGENGQIPILAAAWTPPVAATLLALGLLLHLEDG